MVRLLDLVMTGRLGLRVLLKLVGSRGSRSSCIGGGGIFFCLVI